MQSKRSTRFRKERLLNDKGVSEKVQDTETIEQQGSDDQVIIQGAQHKISGGIDASMSRDNEEVVAGRSQDNNYLGKLLRQFMQEQ